MTDETGGSRGTGRGAPGDADTAADQDSQQRFAFRAQYVKDLSFENPRAPDALNRGESPKVELSVSVNGKPLGDDNHEVELKISARAAHGEQVAFLAELTYGGVFHIAGFAPEQVRPVVLIECPRLLFPFARRILADCTRDGGFPPLMLEPIDFAALYRRSEQARQDSEGTARNGDGAAGARVH